MPSNVFMYQLPEKVNIQQTDKFLLDDGEDTKIVALSTIGQTIFGNDSPSHNFRIKDGQYLQIRDFQKNPNEWRTIIVFNGALALSGIPDVIT
jgi:hypothetical protein